MEDHVLVSREDWTAARLEVLAEEKALMYHAHALAAKRRAMPWTLVEKTYVFDAPEGRVTLQLCQQGRTRWASELDGLGDSGKSDLLSAPSSERPVRRQEWSRE